MPLKDPEKRRARQKVYFARWYRKNADKERARIKRDKCLRRTALEEFLEPLKTKPCTDCGSIYHPVAMDFDHVRGKKIRSISRIVNEGRSLKQLVLELAKCELVCANCHRVRTFLRGTS
jgi:hypothetical protein